MPWCQPASLQWIPSPIFPIPTLHCYPARSPKDRPKGHPVRSSFPAPSRTELLTTSPETAISHQGEGRQAMRTLVPLGASSQLINEPFVMQ